MKKKNIIILSMIIIVVIAIVSIPKGIEFFSNKKEEKKKVGIIVSSVSGSSKAGGLIDGMEQYGYSKNDVDIIVKDSLGDKEKIEELSQELVDNEVDIIVVTSPGETQSVKNKTKEIPVIFIGVGCSVELGFVKDNISPGCNITGIDSHYVQLSGKRLEFLKKMIPETKDVLILYNPTITPFGPSSEVLNKAADRLNIDLKIVPVEDELEIVSALEKNKDSVDGGLLMCNFRLESSIDTIVETSLENKIPVMGLSDHQVEKGVLGAYGSTSYNEGMQSARLVVNVLKGQDPKIIPIEAPEKLEFHLNLDTAEALGIDIEKLDFTFVDKFIRK